MCLANRRTGCGSNDICTRQFLVHRPLPGHTGKLYFQTPTKVTKSWNVSRRDKSCFCTKAVKYL